MRNLEPPVHLTRMSLCRNQRRINSGDVKSKNFMCLKNGNHLITSTTSKITEGDDIRTTYKLDKKKTLSVKILRIGQVIIIIMGNPFTLKSHSMHCWYTNIDYLNKSHQLGTLGGYFSILFIKMRFWLNSYSTSGSSFGNRHFVCYLRWFLPHICSIYRLCCIQQHQACSGNLLLLTAGTFTFTTVKVEAASATIQWRKM